MTSVAVVGTGRMGSAMARALAREGVDLILHNRTSASAKALADELGGRVASTPAEAAAAAEISISILADDEAVRATWDGPDGLVAGAQTGGVLVDMSTVPPDTLAPFASSVRERGAGIVDAPVSGSVALAESGELTIMVGGSAEDLERARPVLDLLSKQVTHIGPLGSGYALKLAVNAVIFALNNGVSEALVLAERAGIDPALAYEVFSTSAAGAPFLKYKRTAFVEPGTTPVAFSLELAAKDLRLITDLADRLGVPMPQARANQSLIGDVSAELGPDCDFSAVASYLRLLSIPG